jgi:hypothetical protein
VFSFHKGRVLSGTIETFQTRVNDKFKPNNFPLCDCDEVVSLWVSHSTKNPGRPFFRCQEMDEDEKCGYFLSADQVTKEKRKKRGRVDPKKVTKTRNKKPKRVKPLKSSDEDDVKPQTNTV